MSLRDVAADVDRWREEGESVALATVVSTWGSGPRGPGAKMALTPSARIAGSVSGGCVETSVVEEGRQALQTGDSKLLRYGVSDETAWEVGLSCGGTIEVFVEPLTDETYAPLRRALKEKRGIARAIVVEGEQIGRSAFIEQGVGVPHDELSKVAQSALEAGRPERLTVGERDVFIDVELPPPRLIVVGGVHIARALTAMASTLGFETVVVDPRGVFGSRERFPHVDELRDEWPDEALEQLGITRSTAVAALSHDPKIDDPALLVALRSPAFFVGALGSRRTHEKRRKRLVEKGMTEGELSRLHAPIGLPIGSRTPEEIALSILGQIVATKNGAS